MIWVIYIIALANYIWSSKIGLPLDMMINLPIFLTQKRKLMDIYIKTRPYRRTHSTLNLFKSSLFRPQYIEL